MPKDEAITSLVRQWLDKADEDYRLAEHLLSEGAVFCSAICFHAQQAAEKYLKAVLVHLQIEFPKIHDLAELLDLIALKNPSISHELQDISELNPYGVENRYPGDYPGISREEASRAVALAGKARKTTAALAK